VALTEADNLVAETPDPFETVAQQQRARIATQLLNHFSARDRAFATLYFGEGLEPTGQARGDATRSMT
jgi:hypothetical protein